jgi:hypothetical protein
MLDPETYHAERGRREPTASVKPHVSPAFSRGQLRCKLGTAPTFDEIVPEYKVAMLIGQEVRVRANPQKLSEIILEK